MSGRRSRATNARAVSENLSQVVAMTDNVAPLRTTSGRTASSLLLLLPILQALLSASAAPPETIHGRIISGRKAAAGQFPWQVIIKRDEWDDLLCGGSIISRGWVLTAGHCAYGLESVFIIFGTTDLFDTQALNMTCDTLIVHPNYNDKMNNDVALVQLPSPLNYSKNIQPIQLVSSSQAGNSFVGNQATIAGYGLVDDEYLEYSQQLLYALVQIIPNDMCESIFGSEVVLTSTMCAQGYAGSNMSTCSGDSGGPLIMYNRSLGQYIQVGINSFVAQDKCTSGYPSGYVRLTSYLDYISQTTGLILS